MNVATLTPEDRAGAIARIRAGAGTIDDLAWLRIAPRYTPDASAAYVCDCRCRCHNWTRTGETRSSCGLVIDTDELDCYRACRAAHLLAGECNLDETRSSSAAGRHV